METQVKKNKSTLKKIADVLYYVLITFVIVLALSYTFFTLSTKNGVTSVFGYIFTSVQSGSMSGTFDRGDIIITKEFDAKTAKPEDIISFYYIEPNTQQKIIVTHRVIEVKADGLITQGDVARKNHSVDQVERVAYGDVIAKYTGTKIPGLGKVADFIRTPTGFFICVLIPVFLFLFWQIYIFIKTLIEAKSLGKQKAINDEARALAEKMFQEMQQNQNAGETPPADHNE